MNPPTQQFEVVSLFARFAEYAAAGVELVGIAVIVALAVYALGWAALALVRGTAGEEIFTGCRHRLARGILLGLEFLVAADIIHTVAIDLTFRSVGVLAIIVAIRTFLSMSLEVEMNGRWPWERKRAG